MEQRRFYPFHLRAQTVVLRFPIHFLIPPWEFLLCLQDASCHLASLLRCRLRLSAF
jgi:hypothetical protein